MPNFMFDAIINGLQPFASSVSGVANLIRSLDRRWRSASALLDRDGKTADQPCDRLQVPGVLVFEESGEPLNTFVVAVEKRYAIDLSFSL